MRALLEADTILARFAESVVEPVSEFPLTYVRNESYFEWQLRNRLADLVH